MKKSIEELSVMEALYPNAEPIQKPRNPLFLIPLALLFVLTMTGQANAQRIITIDAPGAGATTNSYQGTVSACYFTDCSVLINNFGAITGAYLDANNVYHGFVRSPEGKFTTFDSPGADLNAQDYNGTFPNAINDAGAITGLYVDVSGGAHGFLRTPEGAFTTFDVPKGIFGSTTPIGLNLEGAIVGRYADQNGIARPFLRNPDGTFSAPAWSVPGECDANSAVGPCYGSGAFTINVFGTIAGGYEDNRGNFVAHGILRGADGTPTTYEVPGAGTGLYQGTGCPGCTRAVNIWGAVTGYYIDPSNVVHGYVRSASGKFTTYDVPGAGPQGINCYADCSVGMNDEGAITGYYLDANNVNHGFLRSPEGKVTSFDAPGADTTPNDYNGTFPVSINDLGAVTGYYVDANNVIHGFLMFPSNGE
jgi:hypothetical protein